MKPKPRLSEICARVAAKGEAVILTQRGRPLVKIMPIKPHRMKAKSVWDRRADYEKKHGPFKGGNPLQAFILSEELAGAGLARTVDSLKSQGVSVYTYPLALRLGSGQKMVGGAFAFTLRGPPGAYRVEFTTDFSSWTDLGPASNTTGTAVFTDTSAMERARSFYRARRSQ